MLFRPDRAGAPQRTRGWLVAPAPSLSGVVAVACVHDSAHGQGFCPLRVPAADMPGGRAVVFLCATREKLRIIYKLAICWEIDRRIELDRRVRAFQRSDPTCWLQLQLTVCVQPPGGTRSSTVPTDGIGDRQGSGCLSVLVFWTLDSGGWSSNQQCHQKKGGGSVPRCHCHGKSCSVLSTGRYGAL